MPSKGFTSKIEEKKKENNSILLSDLRLIKTRNAKNNYAKFIRQHRKRVLIGKVCREVLKEYKNMTDSVYGHKNGC